MRWAGDVYREFEKLREENLDLKVILNGAFDVLYVSDGQGTTLRVSSSSEQFFGMQEPQLIGKNVRDLERERVFWPSATVQALEKRSPVTLIQQTKPGKRLLVFAKPVLDEAGRIIRVVNVSQDITDVTNLERKLEEARSLVEKYRQELVRFQCEQFLKEHMIIISSNKMRQVMNLVQKVSQVDSTVLITGESGCGKEVIARAIHRLSQRRTGPFVAVNCGAIPDSLLESELFGYERGAFTGAKPEGKQGLIEAAHGGTLFLDEISELPPSLQVKLLRVLQERQVTRIGSTVPRKVDIRVIAASNRNLAALVENGQFRQDLYYRLNVVLIEVPPLRERREEIPALVNMFLEKLYQRYGIRKRISPAALEALCEYSWPGNVRELENTIERLAVITDKETIEVEDLPDTFKKASIGNIRSTSTIPLRKLLKSIEHEIINAAYRHYKNTYTVARVLGISQATVVRKLKNGLVHAGAEGKTRGEDSILYSDGLLNSLLNLISRQVNRQEILD